LRIADFGLRIRKTILALPFRNPHSAIRNRDAAVFRPTVHETDIVRPLATR
jgi:hypothetical protein